MFRSHRSVSDKNLEWFNSEEYREMYGSKSDSPESTEARPKDVSSAALAKSASDQPKNAVNVAPLIEAVSRDSHCRFSTREVCLMLGLSVSTSQADLLKELTTVGTAFDANEIYFFPMPQGEIVFRSRRLNTRTK